ERSTERDANSVMRTTLMRFAAKRVVTVTKRILFQGATRKVAEFRNPRVNRETPRARVLGVFAFSASSAMNFRSRLPRQRIRVRTTSAPDCQSNHQFGQTSSTVARVGHIDRGDEA